MVTPPASAPAATVPSASLSSSRIRSTKADGSFKTIAAPTIRGVATANSQVAVLEDGMIIGTASVDPTGNWSFTSPTLATGRHRLSFEAVNQLGIFSAVACPMMIQV